MQHAIIEQIETCELKATEWRVAMRLLHQADPQGRVVLTREACVALCQVHVWGAASRILCRLAGQGVIGWYSDASGVHIYFVAWGPAALSAREEDGPKAPLDDKAAGALPPVSAAGPGGDFHLLLQAMTDLTRQIGALLFVLAKDEVGRAAARQDGAFGLVEAASTLAATPGWPPQNDAAGAPFQRETRQNGAQDGGLSHETRQNGAPFPGETHENGAQDGELLCETRQNGAVGAPFQRETRHFGAAPHACANARGLSVCLLDPDPGKDGDRQTDLASGSLVRVREGMAAPGVMRPEEARPAASVVPAKPSIPPLSAAPPLPAQPLRAEGLGVEPELALGLLRERVVNLPLRDAQVVANTYPFWKIRDCVFYYLAGQVRGKFRSPRIMLTWLGDWAEWMIPPVGEEERESELFQRYLLPAERQAQAEEEQRRGAWEAEVAALEAARREGNREEAARRRQMRAEGSTVLTAEQAALWEKVLGDLCVGQRPDLQRTYRRVQLVSVVGEMWTFQGDMRLKRRLEDALRLVVGARVQVVLGEGC